ncbi:hypothetical protein ACFPVT_09760 [Corynebacterium choanae]|uniref:Secreted protein n=1 Tax=Corynebacterium choanae TaxID=1862358 RepID=A0A3G6J833_9CORY|nr:hypothetical protein [Corynebacterium choanae]AZA14217.1 hypothetical protein CCHOA_09170 [Corynebacterium choanae]
MHARFHFRLLTVALTCCAWSWCAPTDAGAVTVTADTEQQVCVANFADGQPTTDSFFSQLQADAIDRRLAELDQADPGLAAAIRAYDAGDPTAASPGELQQRIGVAGGREGLGQLITTSAADAGVPTDRTATPEVQRFTIAEADNTIAVTAVDPAADVLGELQAVAANGFRLDEIKAALFAERQEAFNAIQTQLHDQLVDCVETLRPRPWLSGPKILITIAMVGAVAVALLAIRNARRPVRHAKR